MFPIEFDHVKQFELSNWIWIGQLTSTGAGHDGRPMIFRLKILSFAYHNHHDVCTELKLELVELSW